MRLIKLDHVIASGLERNTSRLECRAVPVHAPEDLLHLLGPELVGEASQEHGELLQAEAAVLVHVQLVELRLDVILQLHPLAAKQESSSKASSSS